jgi:uncharacterized protein YndB with AHSA1/START domain
MDIDRAAPLVSRREIFIEAAPDRVWNLLTDFVAWPRWNHGVKTVTVNGPLAPGTVFRWSAGGMTITSKLEVVEPPSRIGWRGDALGTKAVHRFDLAPESSGTRVVTEESMSGWLPSTMRFFSKSFLDRSLDEMLAAIKKGAETPD